MRCPQCGTELGGSPARCPRCQAWLAPSEAETVISSPGEAGRDDESTVAASGLNGDHSDETRLGDGAPVASADDLLVPGETFGPRYRIERRLGMGGMGAVYQARDRELGVDVALKIIRPDPQADPVKIREHERRLKREIILARQVTHGNVVRIHDFGEVGGIKYITMSYVEGVDLAEILRREGALPAERLVRIMRQVADGMAAAHAAGVVHRDLKPSNIMVGPDDRAYIMDFGISGSIDPGQLAPRAGGSLPTAVHDRTVAGSVVGTVAYMAPEQAKGHADERSDIYAFGLICRDALLGSKAPRDKTAVGLVERSRTPPAAPRAVDATLPEGLSRIVTRCLDPEPSRRYQATEALTHDLAQLDDSGKTIPWHRRYTRAQLGTAAALVLAVTSATWWLTSALTPPPAPLETPDPVSVLIADFDDRTGDPVFEDAVEQAMTIALEGAPFISAFSRPTAQGVAEELNPGGSLDEATARLVARREGIGIVLAGAIEPDGARYRVSARAIDPAVDDSELAAASAVARDKDDVLRAVSEVANDIKDALGDTTPESVRLAEAETFTTGSLEAMQAYSRAQELAAGGDNESALEPYQEAIAADPDFGRAYSGLATSEFFLGREADATSHWEQALSLMDRMTDRERLRTLGTYYLAIAGNYEQAVETFTTLVERYPADRVGQNNLGYAYFFTRDYAKALEHGRLALELYPTNVIMRDNVAVFAILAGDFETARVESQRVIEEAPEYDKAYERLALTAVEAGDETEAIDAYGRMGETGDRGVSLSTDGLADLDLYRGRLDQARDRLIAGLDADLSNDATMLAAGKQLTLAETYELSGNVEAAVQAGRDTLDLTRRLWAIVPVARLLARNGEESEARALIDELAGQLQPEPRAYAKVIQAALESRAGRPAEAIDDLRSALELVDVWIAHFDLGVIYVEQGHYAEALEELQRCRERRGEAMTVFNGDIPTAHYLAPLPYWLGRAQEGVGMREAAAESYGRFLDIRGETTGDPLVSDAATRLGVIETRDAA